MQTFYMTDAGKVRTHNEDNVTIISNNNNEFILAVADGMGGHKAGEVASNIAIEHITESFESIESLGKKEDAIEWLRNIVKEINNKIFTGTEVAYYLRVRSNYFYIYIENNNVVVKTKGFGHGVGMSQYGAEGMANNGYTYKEILEHYYQGTTIKNLNV